MDGNFAILLPIVIGIFGLAFVAVSLRGPRAAAWWGVAYLCLSISYCLPLPVWPIPTNAQIILADTMLATAFFALGQGMLDRLGMSGWLALRLGLALGGAAACAFAVLVLQDLRAELAICDMACVIQVVVMMVLVRTHVFRPIDKVLFAIAAISVADNFIRGCSVMFTTGDAGFGDFLSTQYAFAMQITSMIHGLGFALAGLAALALDMIAAYRTEAFTDPLSGALNRRGFYETVADRGAPLPGCIAVCDIDRFKAVNDRFGHAMGDRVIVRLARTILAAMPEGAVAARFGGEEFVVHLPGAALSQAGRFAESVRAAFSGHDWAGDGIDQPLTVSFGLCAEQPGETIADAIARADRGLYAAKQDGRDRTTIADASLALPELALSAAA